MVLIALLLRFDILNRCIVEKVFCYDFTDDLGSLSYLESTVLKNMCSLYLKHLHKGLKIPHLSINAARIILEVYKYTRKLLLNFYLLTKKYFSTLV